MRCKILQRKFNREGDRHRSVFLTLLIGCTMLLSVPASSWALINFNLENDPILAKAMEYDIEKNGINRDKADRVKAVEYYLKYVEYSPYSFTKARVYTQLGVLYSTSYDVEKGEKADFEKARLYFSKAVECEPNRVDDYIDRARAGLVGLNNMDNPMGAIRDTVSYCNWLSSFNSENIRQYWLPESLPDKSEAESSVKKLDEQSLQVFLERRAPIMKEVSVQNAVDTYAPRLPEPLEGLMYLLDNLPEKDIKERDIVKKKIEELKKAAIEGSNNSVLNRSVPYSEDLNFIDNDVIKTNTGEVELHDLKTPKLLVKMQFNDIPPFEKIVKLYDESSLPQFYAILKDEKSSGYESGQAVTYIGLISKRGNKQSVQELLDYIKRGINLEIWGSNGQQLGDFVTSKFNALNWLGYLGGKDVEDILKQAITVDGSKELSKEWFGVIPKSVFSQDSILNNLRGCAAKGLAFSDNPEVHRLIKAEYEKERQVCIDAGEIGGTYINQLTDAMATMDMVKEIGLEAYRELYDGKGSIINATMKYIGKYLLFESPDPGEIIF